MIKKKEDSIFANRDYLTISEVIVLALYMPQYKRKIIELLDFNELYYHALRIHYSSDLNYQLPQGIIDEILACTETFSIIESGVYVDSSLKMHGADPNAYPPDGSWSADLYEFLGHYMWVEPEGREYGFFDNLIAAKRFGDQNWIQ